MAFRPELGSHAAGHAGWLARETESLGGFVERDGETLLTEDVEHQVDVVQCELAAAGEIPGFFGENFPVEAQSVPREERVARVNHVLQVSQQGAKLGGRHPGRGRAVGISAMPELGQVLVATQECHARDAERTLPSPVACGIGQAGGFKIECQVAFGHGWWLIVLRYPQVTRWPGIHRSTSREMPQSMYQREYLASLAGPAGSTPAVRCRCPKHAAIHLW